MIKFLLSYALAIVNPWRADIPTQTTPPDPEAKYTC